MRKNAVTRSLAVGVALLCCSVVSAFGGRPPTDEIADEVEVTIIGHINVYGSEPHTFLGIVSDDEKSYTILAENDVLVALQKTQGAQVALTGFIIPRDDENGVKMLYQTLKDGKFKLSSWKVVSN